METERRHDEQSGTPSERSWSIRELVRAGARQADVEHMVRERARAKTSPGRWKWECVGPTNVAGRASCLAVHPSNPNLVYLGTACGGVWRSRDGGQTWKSLWHNQLVLNIGSLAIDPNNPKKLYCGTGEANSSEAYPGVGMYVSKNEGKTWRLLASAVKQGIPRRIGAIAIDPFNSKHICIGGSWSDPAGMFTSYDAGATWHRQRFISLYSYWCHAIVFHPQKKGLIFTTIEARGTLNGIWRSKDEGRTWEHLTCGLPHPDLFRRTALAIAPSDPQVVYAIAADFSGKVLGVFRSEDQGDSWMQVGSQRFRSEAQMDYGICIVVDPSDPSHVICGGISLHRSRSRGERWTRITNGFLEPGMPGYAHDDHHALVMPPSKAGLVYDANDGGMDKSVDGGTTWTNCSNGLTVTMFYDIDVAPSTSGRHFGGGTQDNGTQITETGKQDDFSDITGGDGGWMVYDPRNSDHLYSSFYRFHIYRHRPNGRQMEVTPRNLRPSEGSKVWMTFMAMDPKDSKTVFAGSDRVWRTQDDGVTWEPVSPVFDGSVVTAIEIADVNHEIVYVGTAKGRIFKSEDRGNKGSWSGNLAGPNLPLHTAVTRLEVHPKHAKEVYASFGQPLVEGFQKPEREKGISHVFRSKDGGQSWEDADRGQLPDLPHYVVTFQKEKPYSVFVANDIGVYMSSNSGNNWFNITGNLPNVVVTDLVYHSKSKTLTVATYGRSIWRLGSDRLEKAVAWTRRAADRGMSGSNSSSKDSRRS